MPAGEIDRHGSGLIKGGPRQIREEKRSGLMGMKSAKKIEADTPELFSFMKKQRDETEERS